MNFLNNLPIKMKLVLMLMFPILGLIIFSSIQSKNYYDEYSSLERIESLILLSTKVSSLVHETQKERGLTAGYLGSKGTAFKNELGIQRELSNKEFDSFLEYARSLNLSIYPLEFKENMNKAISKYEALDTLRKQISELDVTTSKAIKYYTLMNEAMLDNVTLIAKLSSNALLSRKISSFSNFLLSKEMAGIERAVGANTLSRDSFANGMRTKLNNLISAQKIYTKNFLEYASNEDTIFFNKTMQGKEIDEVNKIRATLMNSASKHILVSQMKELVGYGGMIHNFKNYVIRGSEKYNIKIKNQYVLLSSLIGQYKGLNGLSSLELELLKNVELVFSKYHEGLNALSAAKQSGSSVKQLDKIVKVSDGPAVDALIKLSSSLFSVPSTFWFSQMTEKINSLKKVDNYLANKLMLNVKNMSSAMYSSMLLVVVLSVLSIIIAIVFGLVVAKRINSSLENFQGGLKYFFKFLNYEVKDINLLDDTAKDEFGKMAHNVNENIKMTQKNILQDRKLIDETIRVSDRINKGYLDGVIQTNSSNPALNELKNILNKTMGSLNKNLENIKEVLTSYSNLNYLPIAEKNSMEGVIEELINGINALGSTITDTLVINKKNGLVLEKSANVLLDNVDKLNSSSNEAATSLEETAAALEEITSTIINNSDNVASMANYANKVTTAVLNGEKLANETMSAMDEINMQVNSINEAITVIDQIAFQTNILSLNAAVEAATAGESGKGFAVVAQEVRNLASRSAEAAKEIKSIVEIATVKANLGKDIANNMLNGYGSLNKDISKTIELINDVDAASKEQQSGIEQINGAVTELDQQTQMNAAASLETNEIAVDTQKLSLEIVKEANKKEFRGKNDIAIAASIVKKQIEAVGKAPIKKEHRGAVKIANKDQYLSSNQRTIITSSTEDEKWESF